MSAWFTQTDWDCKRDGDTYLHGVGHAVVIVVINLGEQVFAQLAGGTQTRAAERERESEREMKGKTARKTETER